MEIIHVNLYLPGKCRYACRRSVDLYTHLAQQFYQQVYVQDVRDIFDFNTFWSQQYRADDLQRFIFCALGNDLASNFLPPVTSKTWMLMW